MPPRPAAGSCHRARRRGRARCRRAWREQAGGDAAEASCTHQRPSATPARRTSPFSATDRPAGPRPRGRRRRRIHQGDVGRGFRRSARSPGLRSIGGAPARLQPGGAISSGRPFRRLAVRPRSTALTRPLNIPPFWAAQVDGGAGGVGRVSGQELGAPRRRTWTMVGRWSPARRAVSWGPASAGSPWRGRARRRGRGEGGSAGWEALVQPPGRRAALSRPRAAARGQAGGYGLEGQGSARGVPSWGGGRKGLRDMAERPPNPRRQALTTAARAGRRGLAAWPPRPSSRPQQGGPEAWSHALRRLGAQGLAVDF
jgi:hypothetical protein